MRLLINIIHLLINIIHLLINMLHFLINMLYFLINILHLLINILHFLINIIHSFSNILHLFINIIHLFINIIHLLMNTCSLQMRAMKGIILLVIGVLTSGTQAELHGENSKSKFVNLLAKLVSAVSTSTSQQQGKWLSCLRSWRIIIYSLLYYIKNVITIV